MAQQLIEGIAIADQDDTGTSVQMTSISVLCELRDGTGLALRRKRTIDRAAAQHEDADIAHRGSSGLSWKAAASLADRRDLVLDALAASGSPIPGVGMVWPTLP